MVGHSPEAGLIDGTEPDERTLDTAFELLANERRRHVLSCLAANSASMALPELAEDVAVREADGAVDEVSEAPLQDVALSLHHVHLPKLEGGDAIAYDADCDIVALSESSELIEHVPGE